MTLAYKFVATMLMLVEVNLFCDRTEILHDRSFNQSDVRTGSHIGPPNLTGFSGSILTDDFFFGFGSGHLANFRKRGFMPADSDQAVRKRNIELSKMPSLIDEQGAYQLATNWLAALEIDVSTVEKKYRREIIQWRFYPNGVNEESLMLPVYQVEWRGNILRSRPGVERAVVTVTVFGATKQLVDFSVLDDSLFLRPRIQIEELKKLVDLSDEQFLRLSTQEKSNLVVRAAGGKIVSLPEILDAVPGREDHGVFPAKPNRREPSTEVSPEDGTDAELSSQRPFQPPANANQKARNVIPLKQTKTILPSNPKSKD